MKPTKRASTDGVRGDPSGAEGRAAVGRGHRESQPAAQPFVFDDRTVPEFGYERTVVDAAAYGHANPARVIPLRGAPPAMESPVAQPAVVPVARAGVVPGGVADLDDVATVSLDAPAPVRSNRARWVFAALSLLAVAAGAVSYLLQRGIESTDNAQVEGRIYNVSARVSGQIDRVLVRDNQRVQPGDPLVELDHADLDARLQIAQAEVTSARAGLGAARASLEMAEQLAAANLVQARGGIRQAGGGLRAARAGVHQARADVSAARARLRLAGDDLRRARALYAQGSATQAELDARQAAFDQARAALSQASARLEGASTGVAAQQGSLETAEGRLAGAEVGPQQVQVARAAVDVATARVRQAEAAAHLAALNRSYAVVRSPAAGVVSRRTAEAGQVVSPDRLLMAIVPLEDVWVVANFREDQLGRMRAGQPVRVRIDTYPGRDFAAHIESLSGASGSRFALLPPDNASGNFVKVAQRVSVLIRFDQPPPVTLRPGLSANVTVRTGER